MEDKDFYVVTHPLYNIKIRFFFGYTAKEVQKYFTEEISEDMDGATEEVDRGISCWIEEKSMEKEELYLHEIYHVNATIAEMFCIEEEETLAYNYVYLVRMYKEGLEEYKLKLTTK